MEIEQITREIGAEIARAREQMGKTIEEIFQDTKINPDYLKSIEQGRFDFLPRPYVVAYIKTFAGRVGLNGEKLVQRWIDAERAIQAAVDEQAGESHRAPEAGKTARFVAPAAKKPAPRRTYFKEILAGVGLVGLMLALVYLFSRDGQSARSTRHLTEAKPPAEVKEIPIEEMLAESEQRARQKFVQGQVVEEAVPVTPAPTGLVLSCEALSEVWIKVIIDEIEESEFTFQRGNRYQWDAKQQFRVIIGNAGGVRLYLNGRDLGVIGKPGQVARLTIDAGGIRSRRLSRPRPTADTSRAARNMQASADSLRLRE